MNKETNLGIGWLLIDNENEYLDNEGYLNARSFDGSAATLPAAKRAARNMWKQACTGRASIAYYSDGKMVYFEENPYGINGDWRFVELCN